MKQVAEANTDSLVFVIAQFRHAWGKTVVNPPSCLTVLKVIHALNNSEVSTDPPNIPNGACQQAGATALATDSIGENITYLWAIPAAPTVGGDSGHAGKARPD